MVSNTSQLSTKPNQVTEVGGKLEGKSKSSLQLRQNQGENKIKNENQTAGLTTKKL